MTERDAYILVAQIVDYLHRHGIKTGVSDLDEGWEDSCVNCTDTEFNQNLEEIQPRICRDA